jgi:hypothetical protein
MNAIRIRVTINYHRTKHLGLSCGDSLENLGRQNLVLDKKTNLIIHETTKNWDKIKLFEMTHLT